MQTQPSLQEQIQAVEQMYGREGLRSLRAMASKVGLHWRERGKVFRIDVLRMRVLDRLRNRAAALSSSPGVSEGTCHGGRARISGGRKRGRCGV